jgi:hypothetical protein
MICSELSHVGDGERNSPAWVGALRGGMAFFDNRKNTLMLGNDFREPPLHGCPVLIAHMAILRGLFMQVLQVHELHGRAPESLLQLIFLRVDRALKRIPVPYLAAEEEIFVS